VACQLMLITKQPAQIAQIAFGHFIEYFCFFLCPLDRGRVNMWSTEIGADEGGWGGGLGGWGGGWDGGGMWGGNFTFGGDKVSVVDFMIKRNEIIRSALGF